MLYDIVIVALCREPCREKIKPLLEGLELCLYIRLILEAFYWLGS